MSDAPDEPLRAAVKDALVGRPRALEDLLARHGSVETARPNLKLAASFAAELIAVDRGRPADVLAHLGAEDAAPDTARAFLPIAAAHGWVALLKEERDVARAWQGLGELAGDERAPVRAGTLDALLVHAARPGGADAIIEAASGWLEIEDREVRYQAAGVVLELLAVPRVLSVLSDTDAVRAYVSRVICEYADAPRSADRSDGRRRGLEVLAKALAAMVAHLDPPAATMAWMRDICAEASHPQLRTSLSNAIVSLRGSAHGLAGSAVAELRRTLEASAKPLRDPTRLRPGTGRGKATRKIR